MAFTVRDTSDISGSGKTSKFKGYHKRSAIHTRAPHKGPSKPRAKKI